MSFLRRSKGCTGALSAGSQIRCVTVALNRGLRQQELFRCALYSSSAVFKSRFGVAVLSKSINTSDRSALVVIRNEGI